MTSVTEPADPKPTRRRPWLRRLVILAVALLLLVLLAPLLLALPPVRGLVADRVGAVLARKVEIGGASAYWFSGIDLEDVTVHSPEGFDGPLATVRGVHVDLDVLSLLTGGLEARVRVLEPHVTLRRNAAGVRNTEGLLASSEEETEAPSKGAGRADIEVVVIGGRVESIGGTADDAALRDLEVALSLRPGGRMTIEAKGLAAGAASGGGDARLKISAELDADHAGSYEVDVPPLDLSRLARLVADAADVHGLAGTAQLSGRGTLHADGTVSGQWTATLSELRAATAGGASLSVRQMNATAQFKSQAGETAAEMQVRAGDVRLTEAGREVYREPSVTLTTQARYHPDGRLKLDTAAVDVGSTLRAAVEETFVVELGDEPRFQGKVRIDADLARLGALRPMLPALEPLGGGTLTATLEGRGEKDLDLGVDVRIDNLVVRPGDLAPEGYRERSLQLICRANHSAANGSTLRLQKLDSALLRVTMPAGQETLALGLDVQERGWIDGGFDLRLDLESLSRLLGSRMGLAADERLAGQVSLVGTGTGSAESMHIQARLAAVDVRFPPSWSPVDQAATLAAKVDARTQGRETTVHVQELTGMGLSGGFEATLQRRDTGTAVHQAEGQVGLALAQARGLLGGLLGLPNTARLTGQVRSAFQLGEEDAGRRIAATTQISDLDYTSRPTAAPVREARVVLRTNAVLAAAGGRHQAEELKLTSAGITIDASGSSFAAEPDSDVDVSLRISGDATKLAAVLAALLGAGYEDLRGRGSLGGALSVRGSPAHGGRTLIVDGNLVLGSWSTSGLEIVDAKATLARPDPDAPLSLGFVSGLNGGKAFAEGRATLGGDLIPWQASTDLSGVDTSGVLTSQGLGRYLRFALPALLPSGATTPVLSGRLDAHVEAGAGDVTTPTARADFQGRGRIAMAQGEIKQSTLFGAAGGSTFGSLLTGLKVAVPEVGRILEEASRAVAFTDLESQFAMQGRKITIEKTLLTGPRVVVEMKGTITGNPDGSRYALDLPTRVVLQGGAGKELERYLPGGAIPMKVRGTLSDPQPTPDVDAKDLLAGALPGGKPKDILDDIKKKLPKVPKLPNPFK